MTKLFVILNEVDTNSKKDNCYTILKRRNEQERTLEIQRLDELGIW